jgi:hypothetical protein
MLQDLGVLTPSLVVCVAFLLGVRALMRREMAPRRRDRDSSGSSADIPSRGISDQEEDQTTVTSTGEEYEDPASGRRSPGSSR